MQVQRSWDPFTVLARMDREFDDLVRRTWGAQGRAAAGYVPAIEVVRDGEDVVVRLELPGVDLADLSIEVERGRLVISGERRSTTERDAVLVRELRYGAFRREFALPEGIAAEQVEAAYEAGLLDVRVRAAAKPEAKAVRVPISAGRPAKAVPAQVEQEPAEQPAEQA